MQFFLLSTEPLLLSQKLIARNLHSLAVVTKYKTPPATLLLCHRNSFCWSLITEEDELCAVKEIHLLHLRFDGNTHA